MSNLIINPKDINKKAGVSQDLQFGGQGTLLKKDHLGALGDERVRLKYVKFVRDGKLLGVCPLSPGAELTDKARKDGASYISPEEYLYTRIGLEDCGGDIEEGKRRWEKLVSKYKLGGKRRAVKMEELDIIRNDPMTEKILLNRK